MRFIRNEVQKPKQIVPPEKRKTLPFIILLIGVGILIVGVAGFFSAFFFNELIEARWPVRYRDVQTYSLVVGGTGIILYIIAALILKVPLRKTTYYKVTTIVKGEPFDPPRKGDFTRAIYARLHDLSDEWAYFCQVKPLTPISSSRKCWWGQAAFLQLSPSRKIQSAKLLKIPDLN